MPEISFLVVDDFCPDVDSKRREALGAQYRNLNSTGLYSDFRATTAEIEQISRLLGVPLVPAAPEGTGRFTFRAANEQHSMDIHVDHCDWGGILYLNPPEQCEGGTCFWRHNETGLEKWPTRDEVLDIYSLLEGKTVWEYFVVQEGMHRDRWTQSFFLPMKYNRLILFRGQFFHSQANTFGDHIENARLTQLFFFNEAR
jgi:hypothetical protein